MVHFRHSTISNFANTCQLVLRSQTFRLMAEGLDFSAFIGQGPAKRTSDRHVKQSITVCFVPHHV